MVSKFKRWMSVVLPPWWTFAALMTLIVLMIAAEIVMRAYVYGWAFADIVLSFEEQGGFSFYSLILPHALFLYGLWRGVAFHPAWRGKYRQWLEATPWQSSKPLPLGPVHLVWQDAIVVGLATMAWSLSADRLLLPLAFLVPYCILLTLANFRTNIDWEAYVSLAIMASLLLVIGHSLGMFTLMLFAYSVCYLGLRRSLQVFPWSESPRWNSLTMDTTGKSKKKVALWPLVHDAEFGEHQPLLKWHDVWKISLLVAWLVFCLSSCYLGNASIVDRHSFAHELPLVLLGLGWLTCGIRLTMYCSKHWTPISLLGRLCSGRLVIPGYDHVLVAPLLTLAMGYFVPPWLISFSLPLPIVAALSVLVISLITLGMRPTLFKWHLIGRHRLSMQKPGPGWKQV